MRRPPYRFPRAVRSVWRLDGHSFVLTPEACRTFVERKAMVTATATTMVRLRTALERIVRDGRRWRACIFCKCVCEERFDEDGRLILRHHARCRRAWWRAHHGEVLDLNLTSLAMRALGHPGKWTVEIDDDEVAFRRKLRRYRVAARWAARRFHRIVRRHSAAFEDIIDDMRSEYTDGCIRRMYRCAACKKAVAFGGRRALVRHRASCPHVRAMITLVTSRC